jgi:hypothetical protein
VNSPAIPRLPIGASFVESRELVKPSLRSTECLTSATGNWSNSLGPCIMMAALDHKTALLLNQSGKVRNLEAGESREYKLLYYALTEDSIDRVKGMTRRGDTNSRPPLVARRRQKTGAGDCSQPAGAVSGHRTKLQVQIPRIKSRFIKHNFHSGASGKASPDYA